MAQLHTLRAVVKARMVAALDDVLSLLDRTISEFEEDLSKQTSRYEVQSPVRTGDTTPTPSPGLNYGLNQVFSPLQISEIKQEEEEQPVPLSQDYICVKTEESTPQRQTEHREDTWGQETLGEDTETWGQETPGEGTETWGQETLGEVTETWGQETLEEVTETWGQETLGEGTETWGQETSGWDTQTWGQETHVESSDTYHDGDWTAPLSSSSAQKRTETERHQYQHQPQPQHQHQHQHQHQQVQTRDRCQYSTVQSAPGTSATVKTRDKSKTDTGVEKTMLSVCEKSLESIKTSQSRFSCTICSKSYSRKNGLLMHMIVHSGQRPYSCSVCNKTFNHRGGLHSHMSNHSAVKPFSCTVCNKAFLRKNTLKVHMRCHTGEKPYSCPVCQQTFTQSSSLQTHVRKRRCTE